MTPYLGSWFVFKYFLQNSFFTHAPCSSVGLQTDFFPSSSSPHHQLFVSLTYRKHSGGAWVFCCDAILFYYIVGFFFLILIFFIYEKCMVYFYHGFVFNIPRFFFSTK